MTEKVGLPWGLELQHEFGDTEFGETDGPHRIALLPKEGLIVGMLGPTSVHG